MTRVGVDLIEIGRVRRSLERYATFKDRCFTPAEQAYCDSRRNPAESYAGRFAGKEAVGKALGFGVARAFAWKEIEITGRPKPSVRLSGRVAAWAARVERGCDRPLDDALARARLGGRRRLRRLMLEPLYSSAEMRAAEEGHDVDELMERAGTAVAAEVLKRFPDARRIAVVCGGGANGGDGRIAARILREEGCDAVETTAVEQADVIVDALFGTGFHGEPRPEAAATIARINAANAPVVAVDIPSGVDASTGEIAGDAVRAALTVTFHGVKAGLAIAPGLFHTGEVAIAEIGLEPAETELRLVTPAILSLVPRRRPQDNKYSAGAVLVAGGSPGMTGAVCLAAEAAFRADAGYVAVAVPEESLPVVETRLLESVKVSWDDALDAAEKAGALAIGPGLGRDEKALHLRDQLLSSGEQRLVLDADALHELEPGDWGGRAVLTPHAGELARLLGEESAWVNAHRLEAARRGAERFGAVCLLKGADTIVAAPGEGALVCVTDAPGLATAGTGDVLTGVLAAFLAKGVEPRLAAAAAATAHGLAARSRGDQAGMIASDVIAALPSVLA